MDHLASPYMFVENLRYSLESGESLMVVIKRYIKTKRDPFALTLEEWAIVAQMERYQPGQFQKSLPLYRKTIFDLLDLARSGVSIIDPLKAMEKEMIQICEHDLGRHLDKLPFKLMLPMLFMQFPAVLMLIIGPLLIQFFAEVGT